MSTLPKLTFFGINSRLCNFWYSEFKYFMDLGYPIEVLYKDFNDIDITEYEGIATPGNSFGLMDGGFDQVLRDRYTNEFSFDLQASVTKEIKLLGSCLPVGNAINIKPVNLPDVIYAPTMMIPSNVSNTLNAFLATKAILTCIVEESRDRSAKFLIPGMCSNTGRMPEHIVACQMKLAYSDMFVKPIMDNSSWDKVQEFYNYIWNQ